MHQPAGPFDVLPFDVLPFDSCLELFEPEFPARRATWSGALKGPY